jgi:hypothetical protein
VQRRIDRQYRFICDDVPAMPALRDYVFAGCASQDALEVTGGQLRVDAHIDRAACMPATLRIGGGSKPELRQALHQHHVGLNKAADTLFDDPRFTTPGRWTEIQIAAVSLSDLGFMNGATYNQVIARAHDVGLAECPLDTAPHLRIAFRNQPEGSIETAPTPHQAPPGSITVASAPLDDRDETPKGFYLRCVEGAVVAWVLVLVRTRLDSA